MQRKHYRKSWYKENSPSKKDTYTYTAVNSVEILIRTAFIVKKWQKKNNVASTSKTSCTSKQIQLRTDTADGRESLPWKPENFTALSWW